MDNFEVWNFLLGIDVKNWIESREFLIFIIAFTFISARLGNFVDATSSAAFPSDLRDTQDICPPRITTIARGAAIVPFQASSLLSKESAIADAGLSNGRRSRVGWAPKLRLVHVGEPVGRTSELLNQQTKERESHRATIFEPFSRDSHLNLSSNFTLKIEDICIDVEGAEDTYLVVSFQIFGVIKALLRSLVLGFSIQARN